MDYSKKATRAYWIGLVIAVTGMVLVLSGPWIAGIAGGLMIVFSFIFSLRYIRCPYCKKMVELRHQAFCGKCGKDLKNVPDGLAR